MSLGTFGEKLELRSEVEIQAPSSLVWSVLVDFPAHQRWNPYWGQLHGRAEPGGQVTLELAAPGGKSLRVQRRIEVLDVERELVWTGKYGWGLLLRSDQFFRLTKVGEECTRLLVGENLRGPGVTSNNRTALNVARGQALMNQALKRQVEAMARS